MDQSKLSQVEPAIQFIAAGPARVIKAESKGNEKGRTCGES